ncbi:Beta-lactamase-like protein 2 [Thoreauomyces humboldtii]|nr:Beta-lactamase-like protein 2 [Thoreauomyces humboldtii]
MSSSTALPSSTKLTPLPTLIHLKPTITRILGLNPGPFTLQGSNTYLLPGLLIDTGAGEAGYPSLLAPLIAAEKGDLVVLCTHWHADHVGGWKDVQDLCREAGRKVRFLKVRREEDSRVQGPDWTAVSDGEDVVKGVRVITTPGHTEDHCCLWLEEEGILFSGDCILGQGSAVFEDLRTYLSSLRKLLDQLPNLKTIYPGHGPVVEDARERIETYIRHRMDRERQVLDALPASIDTIVGKLYPDVPEGVIPAAARGVAMHIDKLVADGKVAKSNDAWVLCT